MREATQSACKSMTVKEAAEILGKSQQFVRVALQRGLLPFGTAVKLSSKWTYYISPAKLFEYAGVKEEAERGGAHEQAPTSPRV